MVLTIDATTTEADLIAVVHTNRMIDVAHQVAIAADPATVIVTKCRHQWRPEMYRETYVAEWIVVEHWEVASDATQICLWSTNVSPKSMEDAIVLAKSSINELKWQK